MLIIDWDPIGVRHHVAEVKDEYDGVAARLISMIDAGAEVSALADFLVAVETKELGLAGAAGAGRAVAKAVHHFATWKPVLPIPLEFYELAGCVHQGITFFAANTDEGLVRYPLRFLSRPKQLIVKRFLTELLDLNPSGEALQNIWNSTDRDWWFDDDGLRHLFALIRARAGGES